MALTTEQIEWLHCLLQELEDNGTELPMGDYGDVYDIIEGVREMFDAPSSDPYTPRTVEDPQLVDVSGRQQVTINVIPGNMVIDIDNERVGMRFWWDDSDGDPHAFVSMTFEEWGRFAGRA